MKLSKAVKPVSYVKAHAAEIIREVSAEGGEPVVITQNGEAKAVLQGIRDYEEMQETLAFLKLVAMGMRDVEEGRMQPAKQVFDELRRELEEE